MKKIDFLAIGDMTTDTFIRLHKAHLIDSIDHINQEICFSFGDKIPYEFVKVIHATGNAANAAVSAARLGLSCALISDIGTDENGTQCLAELKKNKVLTKYVRIHKKIDTNWNYVLWYGTERTILVKHQEFPYSLAHLQVEPSWIYLTSLGEHSLPYHNEIIAYLATHPNVKLAFQPGTYQIKFGTRALAAVYKRTDIFFCNTNEACKILKDKGFGKETSVSELLKAIHKLGPKTVVITDGEKGAYEYNGAAVRFIPIFPDKQAPYERTGAGDAFSSTITAALAIGKPINEALLWGPVNSMSVVQYVGAQEGLLSREKILKLLKTAPTDYKIKEIQ